MKYIAGVIKLLNGCSRKSACAVLPASSPGNKKYMKSWNRGREREAATLKQQHVQLQGEVIHLEEMNVRKIIESTPLLVKLRKTKCLPATTSELKHLPMKEETQESD